MSNGDDTGEIILSRETQESIARLKSLRPVTEILNFNPERKLNFNPERGWDFSLDRDLNFDMERKLEFDPERELHFGHNSIFFRGYLCPNCKRQVARDSTACSICGASYNKPLRVGWKEYSAPSETSVQPKSSRPNVQKVNELKRPEPPKPSKKVSSPEMKLKSCPLCGMRNPHDAIYCVECGKKIVMLNPEKRRGKYGY